MSEYIYVVQMDIPPEREADFNRIYDTQHIPEITKVPGVLGVTRYKLEQSSQKGMPTYLAIYRCASADIPQNPAWKKASDTGGLEGDDPASHHEPAALDLQATAVTAAAAVRKPLAYKPLAAWEHPPGDKAHRCIADVSVDSRDRIHAYSRDNQAVFVYDRDGNFVKTWGAGRFPGRAHGITVGPDDSVYCINDFDHTVRKFTPDGELLMTLGTSGKPSDTGYDMKKTQLKKNATIARSAPPFHRPTKLAVAPNGDLYVADGYGNARVHRFSAEGELIQSWGEPGTGPGEFMVPHGIRVAADGRVLVADRDNKRIQIFSADGEFLEQWTGFSHPTSLFIDRSGRIYVSEIGWEFDSSAASGDDTAVPLALSVLDADGKLVARWKSSEDGPLGMFGAPHGLCVDSRGDLYVASNNRRGRGLPLQKFKLVQEGSLRPE